MSLHKFLLSFLVLAFLVACTPQTNSPAPTLDQPISATAPSTPAEANPVGAARGPAELQYIFEIPPDPFAVTVSLPDAGQTEALIPAEGGSLSASAADGTQYRLDIPAGALAAETRLRMTPVGQLEGMPFGSQAYAVQLEPEGLQLYGFATLTITPAQDLAVGEQILFGYHALGDNLFLASPVVDSPEIKILIDHFSGYGVTKGLQADIAPVRARIGGDAAARLQSAMAEALQRARQDQLLGNEDGATLDWESMFQQWEEQVVKPRLAAAGESCAAGRLAIETVLSYERQRALLGIGDGTGGGAFMTGGLMDTVAETCMKEEFELCRDDHTIHRIIPAWLGMERQYQLLGVAGEGATSAALENARTYVKRCLTFEMEFHSEGNFEAGGGDGYDSTVDSKIKVEFDLSAFYMKGAAPLVNTAFLYRVSGCSVTSNRGGSTFEAMSLRFIPDTKTPTDTVGYVRDFTFVYYPGNTTESFTVACPDSGTYSSPTSPLWTGIFLLLHEEEMSMTDGGFVATDWEIFGNEYFAKKEWIKTNGESGVTEVGTFKLYHRPK
jgi:hypothetical protein